MSTTRFAAVLLIWPCLAHAADAPRVENQAAYVARCKTETVARYPNARAQADSICQSNWGMIVAAFPMADAILAAAPVAGTTFDPAAAKAKLTAVRWAARPVAGAIASGKLGEVEVNLARIPRPSAGFGWSKNGDTIPFNLDEALRVRGVPLAMIACEAFGASEGTRVLRLAPAGKAPFALTIAWHEAAVASESSEIDAVADFSGSFPTLAELRRDGSEWNPTCPQ